ncbi:MAG: hypothetical protein R3200_02080 [Xanthomonadales bacterium]|nr:hypothetical protein [Xanthomonadales bacterium]
MKTGLALVVLGVSLGAEVQAQLLVGDRQRLAFERPESWAMAHAAAGTLFLGSGPPVPEKPWHLQIGAELASIPHIDRADTRVGFNGTKFEDLNKSPVFGRARLWLSLPFKLTAEVSYAPPVTIDGVRPDGIYGFALERPLVESSRWTAGVRLFGQAAHVEGSITCSEDVFPLGQPDFERNPFGCAAPSSDDAELDHYGLEFSSSRETDDGRWRPFVAFALSRLDGRVQIHAPLLNGVIDRSVRETSGTLRTATLGIRWRPDDRWDWTVAVSYTPLEVERPPDFNRDSDDFWSLRVIARLSLLE